jgi:4-amino-4-deoxy-L-arabinose transferase-like glycosyltransferase
VTDLLGCVVAVIVAALANVVVLARVRARHPGPEGAFLSRVYLATLLMRSALAIVLNATVTSADMARLFWGDSGTYDIGAYRLALWWSGDLLVDPQVGRMVSGWGFFYPIAALYTVFGRNQLLVQLLNATIGSLAVLVIHSIARRLFDARAARWAALMMAFFPQMIFWSAAMYKDPAIILCIAVCMDALMRLRERFTARTVAVFTGAALALMSLRFYVFYFVAAASLGTFLFAQKRRVTGALAAQVLLLGGFLAAFSFAAGEETVEQHRQYFDLRRIQISRLDQSQSAQSGFGVEEDVSTPAGALRAVPKGLLYLLLAPFPWSARGLRQLLTVPEMLVWYALLPSLWRGLRYAVRTRARAALPILAYAASLTLAYSVFQGNVGTAYRQRTQVTMFYFVFMGAGLAERARQRGAAASPALASAQPSGAA